MQAITEPLTETKPAPRAPGRPRKAKIDKPTARKGRPPNPDAIYKNPERLKERKRALYESTGFLVHSIRRLAAKQGRADIIVRADDDPAALFDLLKPMLIAEQEIERQKIENSGISEIIQRRRRTRPAPLI